MRSVTALEVMPTVIKRAELAITVMGFELLVVHIAQNPSNNGTNIECPHQVANQVACTCHATGYYPSANLQELITGR